MTNRLASETSPYLLQHAENPVDWLPWGEAAFAEARRRDVPIFLSVGYAACHWCHVMAHESFDDPATAEALNRDFVPVKVDREELPDVDAVYMDAVVALTGQGGWPLSVFLTPEGRPFFGGTYFPPQRRGGLPAFGEILAAIRQAWDGDRTRLEDTARRLADQTSPALAATPAAEAVDSEVENAAMETLLRMYDWDHGGWGGAPKFPAASTIGLLLRRTARLGDRMALEMARHALEAMAAGGLHDHLGGGFHRYAVDRSWTVPHFEKMLYDNALLARVYVEGWRVTGDERFRRVGAATLDFMRRELLTPEGGFSASLDADTEGEEGRFYVWTHDQIEAALVDPQLRAAFAAAFDLPPQGNFEGSLVLRRPAPPAAVPSPETAESAEADVDRALRSLFQVRQQRTRPDLDDKVVTAWNGLALSAWATAARYLERDQDLQTAQELADFLLRALRPAGRLYRTYRLGEARHRAYLDDHAALAAGLLDLYMVDFDARWLAACVELTEVILGDFADGQGGFFDTTAEHAPLPSRPRTLQDTPVPSGSSLAVNLLLRLEALTGEDRYRRAALPTLLGLQPLLSRHPTAFAAALEALDLAAGPLPQLAIIGDLGSEGLRSLVREARSRFLPRLVVAAGPAGTSFPALLKDKSTRDGDATAYLCREFTCRAPTSSADELRQQLAMLA